MANKKINYKLDRALQRITHPSKFDQIIKEIDAVEIPAEYIEYISVYYADGQMVEISGKEFDNPVPVDTCSKLPNIVIQDNTIQEVKIYIDTHKLETDINIYLAILLGRFDWHM